MAELRRLGARTRSEQELVTSFKTGHEIVVVSSGNRERDEVHGPGVLIEC